jgi:superfamily II DNA or RNA helicase
VNALLRELGIRFHELTSTESSNRQLTSRVIRAFQQGEIQVLTAKRVLDEGVNIPEISRAYILASTTVERQWVQRRGRLLRKCSQINKTSSTIHDFLVLPPHGDDGEVRKIVSSELARIEEFARLSSNFGAADGALTTIHPIVTRFFSDSEDLYAAQ